ncbi:MAG: hypothetical protein WCI71_02135 [Bacteroidota bacterium]
MKKLPIETTLEKIKSYYLEGEAKVTLSAKENQIRCRIHSAYLYMLDSTIASSELVVKKLINTFKISESQAYLDIRSASNIFGDIKKCQKEMLRHIVTEWSIELYKTGKENKDYNLMSKALDKMIRANHLDVDDPDLPDPNKIQPPIQLLSLNFNFIKSSYFHKIDKRAQDEIMGVVNKIQAIIDDSQFKDYLDLFTEPQLPSHEIIDP